MPGIMKADLHVHTYHSGYSSQLPWLRSRECYSDPDEVYRVARARGMDLVCITDHDTLDGCLEFLDAHPDADDFIIGEEIECLVPDVPRLRVHLGVLGLTERIHREIQPLRSNVFEAAAFLRRHDVLFAVNHLFFFFRDQLPCARYVTDMLALAPAVETRNGAMSSAHNGLIEELLAGSESPLAPPVITAGSDAHTLRWVGTTYTSAPGDSRDAFLSSVGAGLAVAGGSHGGVWRASTEIYGVILRFWLSLLGLERQDLRASRRLMSALGSLALLPMQFIPAVVALELKRSEARQIRRSRADLQSSAAAPASLAAPGVAVRAAGDESSGVP
jgi:predicted metal-dependent phosphoesterase TrpH